MTDLSRVLNLQLFIRVICKSWSWKKSLSPPELSDKIFSSKVGYKDSVTFCNILGVLFFFLPLGLRIA